MAQVSIYLNATTQKRLTQVARKARKSISQLVQEAIEGYLVSTWPNDYHRVFGSISDLERPAQPKFSDDASREDL